MENFETLVQNNEVVTAMNVYRDIIDVGEFPSVPMFQLFITKIVEQKQFKLLENIETNLTREQRHVTLYDSTLCESYIINDLQLEYICVLEYYTTSLKQIKTMRFPKDEVFYILQNYYDLVYNQFVRMADAYYNIGRMEPYWILWEKFVIMGWNNTADALWVTCLQNANGVVYEHIVGIAVTTENLEMINMLIERLKNNKYLRSHDDIFGTLYSNLFKILLKKNNRQAVVEKFQELASIAEEQLAVSLITPRTLRKIKRSYLKLKIPFPSNVTTNHCSQQLWEEEDKCNE